MTTQSLPSFKAGREVNLQMCPCNSHLLLNLALSRSPGALRPIAFKTWTGKNWGKDAGSWWCVLRGMHRCYHSLSYARVIRWKPLPGTVLGLSLLVHKLNTLSGALAHTHTAEQFLPWGFSNYPQWMGGSRTRRGPTAWVITHTHPRLPFFLPNIQ